MSLSSVYSIIQWKARKRRGSCSDHCFRNINIVHLQSFVCYKCIAGVSVWLYRPRNIYKYVSSYIIQCSYGFYLDFNVLWVTQQFYLMLKEILQYIGLILGLCLANERRRYKVTASLIGWAQTSNQTWVHEFSQKRDVHWFGVQHVWTAQRHWHPGHVGLLSEHYGGGHLLFSKQNIGNAQINWLHQIPIG